MLIELDPPLFGESVESGLPVVALFLVREEGATMFVVNEMDGRVVTIPESEFLSSVRWSHDRGWHDPNIPRETAFPDVTVHAGEETPSV